MQIRDLNSSTYYGVKVMCVDDLGRNVAVTKPCRTKTKKEMGTTAVRLFSVYINLSFN